MAGGCIKCIRYLVFVFNFIFWILGLGILGFGIYLRVDPNINQVVGATTTQELYVIAYVLIGIGAVMTIVGFLGCCGAYQESPCLLATFFACLLVIFAAQVAAGVIGYLKKDDMAVYWNTTLSGFVHTYGWTNSSAQTTAINYIQRGFLCCGAAAPADYLTTDWIKSQIFPSYYPPTCCSQAQAMITSSSNLANAGASVINDILGTGSGTTPAPKLGCPYMTSSSYFKDGCITVTTSWFASQWWVLVAVGGTILLVELLGMIFGITLCCSVRRRYNAYDGYDQPESQNLVS